MAMMLIFFSRIINVDSELRLRLRNKGRRSWFCVCREPHGPDSGVWVRHPSHRNPQPSHQPGDKEGKSVGFIFIYFSFPLNLPVCKARNSVADPDPVGSETFSRIWFRKNSFRSVQLQV
jgi:hypothetical protein